MNKEMLRTKVDFAKALLILAKYEEEDGKEHLSMADTLVSRAEKIIKEVEDEVEK